MVKFLMLPLVALAVVALMMTPAVASVENYSENWIGDSGVMASEILGTNTQAVVWEVRDPPCRSHNVQMIIKNDGHQLNNVDTVACNFLRRLGRAVLRVGACLSGC
jgi:hypothetical protein